jgi:hypothetical protein
MPDANARSQANTDPPTDPMPPKPAALETARLRYLWAPLITGLAGLVTAVAVQLLTSNKLDEASTNFEKLSETVATLTAEAKANRDELVRLEELVDHLLDDVIAQGRSVPSPQPVGDRLNRLQDLKRQIAASPLKTGAFPAAAPPRQLFSH